LNVEPIAQQFIKTSLLNQEISTLWYMSFLTYKETKLNSIFFHRLIFIYLPACLYLMYILIVRNSFHVFIYSPLTTRHLKQLHVFFLMGHYIKIERDWSSNQCRYKSWIIFTYLQEMLNRIAVINRYHGFITFSNDKKNLLRCVNTSLKSDENKCSQIEVLEPSTFFIKYCKHLLSFKADHINWW
jgi:hypothetical protein